MDLRASLRADCADEDGEVAHRSTAALITYDAREARFALDGRCRVRGFGEFRRRARAGGVSWAPREGRLVAGCAYEYRPLRGRVASGELAAARQGCGAVRSGRAEPMAVPGVSPAAGLCGLAAATMPTCWWVRPAGRCGAGYCAAARPTGCCAAVPARWRSRLPTTAAASTGSGQSVSSSTERRRPALPFALLPSRSQKTGWSGSIAPLGCCPKMTCRKSSRRCLEVSLSRLPRRCAFSPPAPGRSLMS